MTGRGADEILAAAGVEDHDAVQPLPRTWRRVDLGGILDGTWRPPEPGVGSRDDGRGLFYPGRLHVIAAEAESGKTWLGLAAAAGELARGLAAVYLDFEDDEGGIGGRLLTMGTSRDAIRDRFGYIRPEHPLDKPALYDLAEAMDDLKPSLVVLDGVTEAMSLHGMELKDNTDVARFWQLLPRRLARGGAAVTLLDHVVKDREARGGYAIGGVHKLNGLNGAMYLMENRQPFGIGLTGRSRLFVRKDRPGQLRRHAVPAHDGMFWYCDLAVRSHGEDFAEVSLPVPEEHAGPFRPTVIMAKISGLLAGTPGGLSKAAIEAAIGGRRDIVRLALELLVAERYVAVERRGPAIYHTLIEAFDV